MALYLVICGLLTAAVCSWLFWPSILKSFGLKIWFTILLVWWSGFAWSTIVFELLEFDVFDRCWSFDCNTSFKVGNLGKVDVKLNHADGIQNLNFWLLLYRYHILLIVSAGVWIFFFFFFCFYICSFKRIGLFCKVICIPAKHCWSRCNFVDVERWNHSEIESCLMHLSLIWGRPLSTTEYWKFKLCVLLRRLIVAFRGRTYKGT